MVVSGWGVDGEVSVSQFWIALGVPAMNWELSNDWSGASLMSRLRRKSIGRIPISS